MDVFCQIKKLFGLARGPGGQASTICYTVYDYIPLFTFSFHVHFLSYFVSSVLELILKIHKREIFVDFDFEFSTLFAFNMFK
jgi:hypothetical protein